MIYTREHFNDKKGVTIWIAWNDEGQYETAPTEEEARERLTEPIDWKYIALMVLTNDINRLPQSQINIIDNIIKDIRAGKTQIINRKAKS